MFKSLVVSCILAVASAAVFQPIVAPEPFNKERFINSMRAKYEGVEFFSEEDIKHILMDVDFSSISTYSVSAIMNDYADKIFHNVQEIMIKNGLDPFGLSDINEDVLGLHMNLTNGWIQDLSTVHRSGDVKVEYNTNTKVLEVTIPMAFDSLQFSYDLNAHWLLLWAEGGVTGAAYDVTVNVVLDFDVNLYLASLKKFDIHTGSIKAHIESGHPLGDTFLNLILDAVTFLLRGVIDLVIDLIFGSVFRQIVAVINDFIQGILNPPVTTTEIAATTTTNSFKLMKRFIEQVNN